MRRRAMLHDPAVYAAPAKFDPGRFMDEEGAVDPRGWVYGFGRRCVVSVLFGGRWC